MGRRHSSVGDGLPLASPSPAQLLPGRWPKLRSPCQRRGSQRLESHGQAWLGLMRPRLAGGLMSWGRERRGARGGLTPPVPGLFPISKLVSLQADLPAIHSFNTWLPSALLLSP